ncbi:hypothetical protein FOXB_14994 [Fusarium oxysporum f. sp. conglutinans Fo5176]|uniref:F-box domain-containing protein n=1 Tax=Fusarium oxysporum (strain Fo5176) TaxID=660025 RepID=F9G8L2_FUSOF|nr:hypothetical protein FOXB_14994 [Fusarium oxysporum f. sp. conglutinans Fo5176]
MSPPSFMHLPHEVHLLIGRHLQPSEMEGLILSSRHMRVTYCRAFYHSVAFRGTKADLMGDLGVSPRRSQPAHYPGNDPCRQAYHVRGRARTTLTRDAGRGIQLDLWWFSDAQREELRNSCVALSVWTGLWSIQMEEADPELLAVLASKTRAESFSGLQLEGQLDLQAARRCFHFLRRLVIPFELPAVPAGNLASTPAGVHNDSEMLLDFGRLEWLVLAPVQLPVGGMEAVRADPKLFVRALVKDVSSLRHLERLGLAFPRAILVAHQPGVPGTGTGQPAAPGTQILPQHHNAAESQNLIRAHRSKI